MSDSSFELESEESIRIAPVTSVKTSSFPPVVVAPPEDEDIQIDTESEDLQGKGPVDSQTKSDAKATPSTMTPAPSQPLKSEVLGKSSPRHQRTLSQSQLPVWSRDTANPNTFDIDYLLSPDVQKRVSEGHRFAAGAPLKSDRKRSVENAGERKCDTSRERRREKSPEEKHAEHLISYKSIYESKVKSLEEQRQAVVMKECTFRPQINSPSHRPRSPEDFYADMAAFQQSHNDRLSKLREEQEELTGPSQFSFKPSICPNADKLAASVVAESVFARLHRSHSRNKVKEIVRPLSRASAFCATADSENDTPKATFSPKINPKSQRLQRQGAVGDRLLEDAKRRREKSKELPPRPGSPTTDPKSQEMVTQRFTREIDTAIGAHTTLTYHNAKEVMIALRFLEDTNHSRDLFTRFWHVLVQDSTEVSAAVLKSALFALMNYNSPTELRFIHREFYSFFASRTGLHKAKAGGTIQTAQRSVSPSVEEQAECADRLFEHRKKVEEKVEELRKEIEKEEMKVCSFSPAVNGKVPKAVKKSAGKRTSPSDSLSTEYRKLLSSSKSRSTALNSLATLQQQRKDTRSRSPAEAEVAKNVAECTFSPKVHMYKGEVDVTKPAKGVEETVERLKKARVDSEWKSLAAQKGRPNSRSLQKERQRWESSHASPPRCI